MYIINADYIASVPIYSAYHVSSYHSRDPDDASSAYMFKYLDVGG